MDSKIERILCSGHAYMYVDTDNLDNIAEVLSGLGFQDWGRDTPHEGERVLVDVKPQRRDMATPNGDKIIFESCYGVSTTCYSRVEDCPVPLEVATALHERGLRVAVWDNKDFTGHYLIESDPKPTKKAKRKPKRVRIELTRTHERALEYVLNTYGIDLMPIGRAFLDQADEPNPGYGEIGENKLDADGIYVMYFPLNLSEHADRFEFNLHQLCSFGIEGIPVHFVGFKADKKWLSGLFVKKRWPLTDEHRAYYEQFFPFGKGETFDACIKEYGYGKPYEVVVLRESPKIDTSEILKGNYFFTPLD